MKFYHYQTGIKGKLCKPIFLTSVKITTSNKKPVEPILFNNLPREVAVRVRKTSANQLIINSSTNTSNGFVSQIVTPNK
jgi:hypothetical protein